MEVSLQFVHTSDGTPEGTIAVWLHVVDPLTAWMTRTQIGARKTYAEAQVLATMTYGAMGAALKEIINAGPEAMLPGYVTKSGHMLDEDMARRAINPTTPDDFGIPVEFSRFGFSPAPRCPHGVRVTEACPGCLGSLAPSPELKGGPENL